VELTGLLGFLPVPLCVSNILFTLANLMVQTVPYTKAFIKIIRIFLLRRKKGTHEQVLSTDG